MKYKNGVVFTEDFVFVKKDFSVNEGLFSWFCMEADQEIDLGGRYVLPGLVDLHLHGSAGVDFCSADMGALKKLAVYLARNGTTSFAAANFSLPLETLRRSFKTAGEFYRAQGEERRRTGNAGGAKLCGIYMEGPFLSVEKRGGHEEQYLRLPDAEILGELFAVSNDLIKLVCIAPELPGATAFIRQAQKTCVVSLGHTAADYEQAAEAFSAGARQITHLFNAMNPFLHREPGLIGAAADHERVRAELICDGIHIHESAVRAAFRWFTGARIILISDAASTCGVEEGAVRQADGRLAGSNANLFDGLKKAVEFGIKPEDAIRAASINPALSLGVADRVGSLAEGKQADFLICNQDFDIEKVYVDGEEVV